LAEPAQGAALVDVTAGTSSLSPLRAWPICLRSCPPPACGRLLLDFAAADRPLPALRSRRGWGPKNATRRRSGGPRVLR